MAIAQKWLASRFDKDLFDYKIYTFCGDGELMEGVSNEAASVAGHLGLNNLIWFYDNNHITIEGSTSLAFTDDVATRFRGWNWNVEHISDVNNLDLIDVAIKASQREPARPTIVITDTHIGFGSPNRQDTREAHGEALGVEEVRLTKLVYGWPPDSQFLVPMTPSSTWARRRTRRRLGKGLEHALQCVGEGASRSRQDVPAHPERHVTGRLGQGHPNLPRRREGYRDEKIGLDGTQRGSKKRSVAAGWLG